MICHGFVHHPDTIKGKLTMIDLNWLTDRSANWEVNVAGKLVRSVEQIIFK